MIKPKKKETDNQKVKKIQNKKERPFDGIAHFGTI